MRLDLSKGLGEVDHLNGSFRRSRLEEDASEGDRRWVGDHEGEDGFQDSDGLVEIREVFPVREKRS